MLIHFFQKLNEQAGFAGKMVMPNRSSAKFRSVLAILDQRVELDKRISYGNRKYNASLSIMASKLSYENEAFVKTIIKDHWNVSIIDMTKQIFA